MIQKIRAAIAEKVLKVRIRPVEERAAPLPTAHRPGLGRGSAAAPAPRAAAMHSPASQFGGHGSRAAASAAGREHAGPGAGHPVGSQGGPQRSLPVREREEVQALPRPVGRTAPAVISGSSTPPSPPGPQAPPKTSRRRGAASPQRAGEAPREVFCASLHHRPPEARR